MIIDYATLKLIWWVLVGALLIGFAITDGMDMGVGILLNFVGKREDDRRVMINTVGPHWDGNQVWLVTAGGAIFAAWPDVYGAAFSGFYMAMLLVLFALFLRPAAFDFRSKIDHPAWRRKWDWALFVGSAVPALIFGVAFGNLLQGVPFHLDEMLRAHYEGALLSALLPLLNPFALLAGVVSFCMLAMHGGVWLQLRTVPPLADRSRNAVTVMGLIALVGFILAGFWVASGIDGYRAIDMPQTRDIPNILDKTVLVEPGAWMAIYSNVPAAIAAPAAAIGGMLLTVLLSRLRCPGLAFFTSMAGVGGVIATAGFSMFPFIMPSSTHPNSSLTVWDATSSHLTLTVMFWAVAVLLPLVIIYNIWCYWRMWGKVTVEDIRKRGHTAY